MVSRDPALLQNTGQDSEKQDFNAMLREAGYFRNPFFGVGWVKFFWTYAHMIPEGRSDEMVILPAEQTWVLCSGSDQRCKSMGSTFATLTYQAVQNSYTVCGCDHRKSNAIVPCIYSVCWYVRVQRTWTAWYSSKTSGDIIEMIDFRACVGETIINHPFGNGKHST